MKTPFKIHLVLLPEHPKQVLRVHTSSKRSLCETLWMRQPHLQQKCNISHDEQWVKNNAIIKLIWDTLDVPEPVWRQSGSSSYPSGHCSWCQQWTNPQTTTAGLGFSWCQMLCRHRKKCLLWNTEYIKSTINWRGMVRERCLSCYIS